MSLTQGFSRYPSHPHADLIACTDTDKPRHGLQAPTKGDTANMKGFEPAGVGAADVVDLPATSSKASGASNGLPFPPPFPPQFPPHAANIAPFPNPAFPPLSFPPYYDHSQAQQAHYHNHYQWSQYRQHMAHIGATPSPLWAFGPRGAVTASKQQTLRANTGTSTTLALRYANQRGSNLRSKSSVRPSIPPWRGKTTNPSQSEDGYALHLERSHGSRKWRVDKVYRSPVSSAVRTQRSQHKEPKIHLPAPEPTVSYLDQASGTAEVVYPPDRKLVILDLNGTLLYRLNARAQPTKMIGRPRLHLFLQYLFDNFSVMIWSSAKPENVKILVERGLENFQPQLVASWARNTLGLSPQHYNRNVQCYKDLTRVWASDDVQRHMPGYGRGKRFDQRNTILIDDSALKANAQPYNLLKIPEFNGSDAVGKDILGEVAGYLELLKMQQDVSKFIHKEPFNADGTWNFDWEHLTPLKPEAPVLDQETDKSYT